MGEPIQFTRPFQPPVEDATMLVEQQLLGSIMMNAAATLPRIPQTFSSAHYADDMHRGIHEAAVAIGPGANALTVAQALGLVPEDRRYLTDLMVNAVGWMATESYAHAVTEAHHRREIVAVSQLLTQEAQRGPHEAPAIGIINLAMARLDALLANTQHYGAGCSLDAAMDAAVVATERAAKGEAIPGRSTGMLAVDEALGGLENGTFNVLGGRPGMGKTALAAQWAISIAQACKAAKAGGVLGFSLEMSATALARRVLAEASRISVVDLKRGRIEGRIGTISRVRGELAKLPLWIEDSGGQNLPCIRQKARAAQRRYGHLALIWVDHIQIVKPDDADRKNGGTQAVGRISNALRDLSKEFDCPVLCLSQLSRGLIGRDDKRPNMGDLRQAGDIEQDADSVMFVHREEVFLPKSAPPRGNAESTDKWNARVMDWEEARERTRGKAELILEKVRDGAPTVVHMRFDGATTSFSEALDQEPAVKQPRLSPYNDPFDNEPQTWAPL